MLWEPWYHWWWFLIFNVQIKKRTAVNDIAKRVGWNWVDHVGRREDGRWSRALLERQPRLSERSISRPPVRWRKWSKNSKEISLKLLLTLCYKYAPLAILRYSKTTEMKFKKLWQRSLNWSRANFFFISSESHTIAISKNARKRWHIWLELITR